MKKRQFKLKSYRTPNFVMCCDTEEKAKKFLKFLDYNGLKWCDGKSYREKTHWHVYKEKTYYRFNCGSYGDADEYDNIYGDTVLLDFDAFDWNGLNFLKENVKMDKVKFKKGDVVIIKKDLSFAINPAVNSMMEKFAGRKAKISSAFSDGYADCYRLDVDDGDWCWTSEMFEKPVKKIVITTDGRTTEAKLYQNGQTIKSAKAICSYDDEFDFMTGARTAFLRLDDEFPKECSLNKPKYYYTGKVICIGTPRHLTYTRGRTYIIVNGVLIDDDGDKMFDEIESLNDLNQRSLASWIEAVE